MMMLEGGLSPWRLAMVIAVLVVGCSCVGLSIFASWFARRRRHHRVVVWAPAQPVPFDADVEVEKLRRKVMLARSDAVTAEYFGEGPAMSLRWILSERAWRVSCAGRLDYISDLDEACDWLRKRATLTSARIRA
jgi:hypothetical protein